MYMKNLSENAMFTDLCKHSLTPFQASVVSLETFPNPEHPSLCSDVPDALRLCGDLTYAGAKQFTGQVDKNVKSKSYTDIYSILVSYMLRPIHTYLPELLRQINSFMK